MTNENRLFLAFYGDDFTGSTDALDFLCKAGIETVLFIDTPSEERLKKFEGIKAIGIAGTSRSMTPEAMEKELNKSFTALREINPIHVHYKVCSTFDSAPHIGSIGRAIDTGLEIFGNQPLPLLVAAPALGRYCAFGNLFARMGIGGGGKIYRLDRHPAMRKHPITPSDESDLQLHLSKQTSKSIGLVDVLDLEKGEEHCLKKLESLVKDSAIILFDSLNESHLTLVGALIEKRRKKGKALFSVGSSGVEMALGSYLNTQKTIKSKQDWPQPEPASPLLVVSGSCSPITAEQISHALANNFAEIELNTDQLASNENHSKLVDRYVQQAVALLHQGQHLIIHSSKGPDDDRLHSASKLLMSSNKSSANVFGTALGLIVNGILSRIQLKRLVIAGGDTSGFVAKTMGIEAIEMLCPFAVGAPMCKAHTVIGYPANGIEINFKGGQVGAKDYFIKAVMNR
ncbi:four-carbon acid sugar kinase family protein [Olivibacter sp. SDN3]|uniref:four-carbon acid sugar kinase family protein n=1 Tax=Olivibacter sp. SDN3 TaxID=2764720 RepID=UPI0016517BFE|nr:four-carbon acid sugar kinase family protein [Olivibacter sp. SDN3]QNL51796.1 four-carbon acid sugar kinase family protein [Olivibacter sp. SDN3]